MNSNLEELFSHERNVISNAKEVSQNLEDYDTKKHFEKLTKEYEKLLKQTMKVFKISDRNQLTLHNTQNQLQSLLDNSDQGFLSFGENLRIDAQYSLECKRVFGDKIAGQNCVDLIFYNTRENIEESVIDAVFSAEGEKRDIYLSLLPEELEINNKIIRVKYKYIEKINKIMVILTDISEKRELENNLEVERNNLRLIVFALTRHEDFKMLTEEYKEYFNYNIYEEIGKNEKIEEVLDDLLRQVHTFKGNFGQWFMNNTADYLHKFEEKLSDLRKKIDIEKAEILNAIVNQDFFGVFNKDLEIIEKSLGEDFMNEDSYILVDKSRIVALEHKIEDMLPESEHKSIIKEIKKLRSKKLTDILNNYKEIVMYNAKKYNKEIEGYKVNKEEEIYVDNEKFKGFFSSLIHIFTNMVVHGIESPEDRVAYDKGRGGNITCSISKKPENIIISIRDDGNGIDITKIKEKAIKSGILAEDEAMNKSDNEILNLIFLPGLSTSGGVTRDAGRGYGLSALKEEVEKLKGNVCVNSEKRKYTEFIISIPKNKDIT